MKRMQRAWSETKKRRSQADRQESGELLTPLLRLQLRALIPVRKMPQRITTYLIHSTERDLE